ncbi:MULTISPECIES: DUF1484 family protein [Cupriavidus]
MQSHTAFPEHIDAGANPAPTSTQHNPPSTENPTLAASRYRDLVAELILMAAPDAPRVGPVFSEITAELGTLGDTVRDATLESCDALLRVSAALESVLAMLDQQREDTTLGLGLHALLLPQKVQLDLAVGRIQGMY